MDLVLLFRALLKRKWILIIVPIIAGIIGYLVTMNEKPEYKSTAQLATGFTVSEQVNITDSKFNMYEADVKFNNLIETITSPISLGLLSYRLMLHDLPQSNDEPFRTIEEKEKLEKIKALNIDQVRKEIQNKLDSMELLTSYDPEEKQILELLEIYNYDYESLKKSISVNRIKSTDYISIDAYTENPHLSAYMVNTLCDVFFRYNKSMRSNRMGESIETLSNLVDQKRNELERKTQKLREFKSSNNVLNFELESSSKIAQITKHENSLDDTKQKLRSLEYELSSVKSKLKSKGSNIPGNKRGELILHYRKKINEFSSKYSNSNESNQRYKDSLDHYRSLYSQLASTENNNSDNDSLYLSKNELQARKSELETEIKITKDNIESLEENLKNLKENASGYASKEAKINQLEREVELASKEYSDAQEKYNKAMDISLASNSSIRQVLYGQPASEPEPSKRLISVALSGASSFALCVFIILLLEYLDMSIRSPSNFQRQVDLRLLGVLNNFNIKSNTYSLAKPKKNIKQKKTGQKDKNHELVAEEEEEEDDFEENIISNQSKHKIQNEASNISQVKGKHYKNLDGRNQSAIFVPLENSQDKSHKLYYDYLRKLRFEIESNCEKVILFTSTQKKQGKSTTMIGLARSFKLSRKKVLIIDCNFVNNALTNYFEAEEVIGNVSINNSNNLLKKSIKHTNINGIDVIGCQKGDYSPSEVISKEVFSRELEELRPHYDYIFIEGASLNNYADSKELSSISDSVIVTFSADTVIRQSDRESMNFFNYIGSKFSGAILNNVKYENLDQ